MAAVVDASRADSQIAVWVVLALAAVDVACIAGVSADCQWLRTAHASTQHIGMSEPEGYETKEGEVTEVHVGLFVVEGVIDWRLRTRSEGLMFDF